MPYRSIGELPTQFKGLPKRAREIAMNVINSALGRDASEESAFKQAWGTIKKSFRREGDEWVSKEAIHPHGEHTCVCPKCDAEITVAAGVKCNEQKCPKCGVQMRATEAGERRGQNMESVVDMLEAKQEELEEAGKRNATADAGRLKQILKLVQELLDREAMDEDEAAEALRQADEWLSTLQEITRAEDGVEYPASAFAYVPESDQPSTWKLRLWENAEKKVTKSQLGRAAAALSPGGFRGQKVQIPSEVLSEVKRTIRTEYRKLGVEDDDMSRWVKEGSGYSRQLVGDYIPLTEAAIDKGEITLTVIKPGFNVGKGRYYPADTLKRDFGIFEGIKMYTDHPSTRDEKERPERSIKDWVATTGKPWTESDGTIKCKATIVEPWMQEKLATLRDKGMLQDMGVSINAVGMASAGEINGTKTKMVERLVRARSVDFVTEAGAGGGVDIFESVDPQFDIDLIGVDELKEHRPDLVELLETSIRQELNKEETKLSEQEENIKALESQIATLTQEKDEAVTKLAEADQERAKAEAQATIKEAVDKAELPQAAKDRLIKQFSEAAAADGIELAINEERDYIGSLSGAGEIRNLGRSDVPGGEATHAEMVEAGKDLGMNDEQAEIFANGR